VDRGDGPINALSQTTVNPAVDDRLTALDAFGVLGRRYTSIPAARFVFYLVDSWPTPSFSPLLLRPGIRLVRDDLDHAESLYRRVRCANPHVKDLAYLTVIADADLSDPGGLSGTLAEAGWQQEGRPLSINIFSAAVPLRLPPGHAADIVDATDGLPATYCDLLRSGFNSDPSYLTWLRAAFSGSDAPTRIATIRNQTGAVVAGGAVSVRGELGFLTWGTVAPAWRDRGYHSVLLNYCLALSGQMGATTSILTTRNDRVRGRYDRRLELTICRKTG